MDRAVVDVPGNDNAISLIRAVSMCAIVLCHIFQYYEIELAWWFNVGVQMFFTMSGFLYGNKEMTDPIGFIVRRFKRILVPYYLYVLPVLVLYLIFSPADITSLGVVGLLTCTGTIWGLGHLWFISYILFCYFITPYLFWFRKKLANRTLWSGMLLCGVMLVAFQKLGSLTNARYDPTWISCYIVGYYMAYFVSRFGRKVLTAGAVLFGVAAVCSNGIRIWLKYISPDLLGAIPAQRFDHYEEYARALLGIGLFLVLYAAFSQRLRGGYLLRLSDRYSYHVYLVHHLYILGPFTMLAFTSRPLVNCCIVLCCACVTAFLLKQACDRVTRRS